jgi:hypothetical protein
VTRKQTVTKVQEITRTRSRSPSTVHKGDISRPLPLQSASSTPAVTRHSETQPPTQSHHPKESRQPFLQRKPKKEYLSILRRKETQTCQGQQHQQDSEATREDRGARESMGHQEEAVEAEALPHPHQYPPQPRHPQRPQQSLRRVERTTLRSRSTSKRKGTTNSSSEVATSTSPGVQLNSGNIRRRSYSACHT